jgi:membrane protease YdiL (CAAX protease family)
MPDASHTRSRSRFSALASRHPVALFLVLALGSVYVLSIIPILMQFDVIPGKELADRAGVGMERATAALLTVLLLAAMVLVTAMEGGRAALRELLHRMLRWRVGLGWWLVAVAALPALTVGIAILLGDRARMPSASVLGQEVVGVVIAFLLINLWEESAWAGFMQTRLERRHNFFIAAALTAIPFAAIHLPLRVITGEIRSAADFGINFALLLVLGLIVRPLMGMVLRGAANSLLLVGLTHTFFNRSNNNDGIAADILIGDNRQNAALLATLVLTVLVGVVLRTKLTRSYRRELDDAENRSADADLSVRRAA